VGKRVFARGKGERNREKRKGTFKGQGREWWNVERQGNWVVGVGTGYHPGRGKKRSGRDKQWMGGKEKGLSGEKEICNGKRKE